MIDPAKIPQFTGDLGQLEHHTAGLRKAADGIRLAGDAAHSRFQGLSAFYDAPEADDLFASTAPVRDGADAYADKVATVAEALTEYATAVRPIAERLKHLKARATTFVSSITDDSGKVDDDWRKDDGKLAEYDTLYGDIIEATTAFQAAEVAANNKITALVGGTRFVMESDGPMLRHLGDVTYGYTADVLKKMDQLPWGAPESKKREGLDWVSHQVTSFTEGFLVDGGWEMVQGLVTLAGFNGSDAQEQAWNGLGLLATGVAVTATPLVGDRFWRTPAKDLPPVLRDARTAMTETGKAFVAYDMWGKNPARASGTVTFNVITTVFTGGTGAAAKGGAAARTAAVVGKAANAVNPITYLAKGAKFTGVTVRDVMATLKNTRSGAYVEMAGGAYRLPDPNMPLPTRAAGVPEHAMPFVDAEGKVVYLDTKTFAVLDEHGKVIQRADEVQAEGTAAERAAEQAEKAPQREPVMAGTGERPAGTVGRAGDDLPAGTVQDISSRTNNGGPDGHVPDSGRGASASHEPPGEPLGPAPSSSHGDYSTDVPGHGSDGLPPGSEPTASSHLEAGARPQSEAHTSGTHENGYSPDQPSADTLPPPGPGEKVLGHLDDHRVTRGNGLITHVDGRAVSDYLDDVARDRGATYRAAKEAKAFPRKQTGACVGAVVDLRTGTIIEGINGKADAIIPLDKLHPTLAARYDDIGTPPPHNDHPLGHAEVKAANELLWERTKLGLPDGESALSEMRASVEFPYLTDKATGTPGRPAPFCANCNFMLDGMPSSHGRFTGYPPSDENWTP
ncbi:hypothetical protein AB0B50_42725 [Streptomyces sp. NPDC041068]|uniref:hypothetical protein n=1 Tax=Streptomyces sp. NPDC041068 TaxID=3155130 RepID=UPI003402065C